MTDRDLRFADEYLIDYDAKNAAIRAGYSPKTARNAAEWIHAEHPKKPALRAMIDEKLAELSRRAGVSAERVMRELARIAFVDIGDVVDVETGGVRSDARRADRVAIAAVRVKKGSAGVEREVRMCDKTRALELLGKRLGLFTENVQLTAAAPVILDDAGEAREDG